MSEPFSSKSEARLFYLEKRRSLSSEDWQAKSGSIFQRIINSSFYQESNAVLCYISSKDNEVDTHALLASAAKSGKSVLVPYTAHCLPGTMRWAEMQPGAELVRSAFGLLEPAPGTVALRTPPPGSLCIIPGIAFTREGHRLGYGGGYYDRFLKSHKGVRVALGFDLQIADSLPFDNFDETVHYLVTETEVIHASKESR
jgi:5-formyltetrahydrofolate cyclo-ligase